MSKKYIISDLHLGHKQILKYSPTRGGTTWEEHDLWIMDQWNSVVTKHDLVYVLGDVAMTREALDKVKQLKGNKILIRGNHDVYNTRIYLEYFQEVYGLHHHRGVFWMSHAPIHPIELRNRFNLHGHVHQNSITRWNPEVGWESDINYINCCVEMSNGVPQNLEDLYDKYKEICSRFKENK